jgi:hypothetical protein
MKNILDKLKFAMSAIESFICTKSETDVILATLNGECKGEPVDGQTAVRNVIANRANGPAYMRQPNPLYAGANNEVIACLSPFQFSVWNSAKDCPSFLTAYNRCMQGATITAIPAVNYSVFTQGTGLSEDQAKKIYLYCNPDAKASRSNKSSWVKLVVSQSDANPGKKTWSITTNFNGQKNVKITFIRIGRHVFVHGIQ